MGYEGPMQGFDEFLNSDPAAMIRYNSVTDKFAKRMAEGGVVEADLKTQIANAFNQAQSSGNYAEFNTLLASKGITREQLQQLFPTLTAQDFDTYIAQGVKIPGGTAPSPAPAPAPVNSSANLAGQLQTAYNQAQTTGNYASLNDLIQQNNVTAEAAKSMFGQDLDTDYLKSLGVNLVGGTATTPTGGTTTTAPTTPVVTNEVGVPQAPGTTTVTAATTNVTPEMKLDKQQYQLNQYQPLNVQAANTGTITTPDKVNFYGYEATTVLPTVETAVKDLVAAQGKYAPQIQAAQLTEAEKRSSQISERPQLDRNLAPKVELAQRNLQQGELVGGNTVDMNEVENTLARNQAAQLEVTDDMTISGQLAKLTQNFSASNPPPWAAGALRAATETLAARGLGASSLAGQAVIQATLEKAMPIAAADAATYTNVAVQNLSNRQQMALAVAEQRAKFLGQKFDQDFQTRVINAAKIADIANMNFNAQQQVYLENARLVQQVDLANLGTTQAILIANAANLASMEKANLDARQQASILNAENFLKMEVANMNNQQQMAIFKAQTIAQAALSDAAAVNSARQFNATGQMQVEQFNANMSYQVQSFNVGQANAMARFNAEQAAAMAKFNAEMDARRDEFNSKNALIIDQANAQLTAQISTANTAAINAANITNAQAMNNMTASQYNNEVMLYRDQVKMVYDAYERQEDRAASMATAMLQADIAKDRMDAETSASYGKLLASMLTTNVGQKLVDAGVSYVSDLFTG